MHAGSRRAFINSGIAAALSPFYTAGVAGQTAARVRPFLQNLHRKSVSINWIAVDASAGSVALSSGQRFEAQRKRIAPGIHLYRADLSGLEPGQPYSYSIRLNNAALPGCEALSFRTQGEGGSSRIVALGDSGTDSPAQRKLAAMMTARQPELMLHTGDLVYPSGTLESYMERFFAPYAPLLERIPVFPCPGNHDYYHEQANFYVALHALPSAGVPEEGQGRYYSFDWDNAHIVVLDSNVPLVEAAEGRGQMLTWLDQDLTASRHFWKFAMFHHPPFAGGPNQGDPLSHLARQHIVPILEKHGGVFPDRPPPAHPRPVRSTSFCAQTGGRAAGNSTGYRRSKSSDPRYRHPICRPDRPLFRRGKTRRASFGRGGLGRTG